MTRFIVSYFGVHDPRHVAADLADIARDFDGVNFPVTEQDVAFDAAGVVERVRMAREAGLTVWLSPWGLCGLFGGEGLSAVGHLCSESHEVRDAVYRWCQVARMAKPDAVLLDEPRGRCCSVVPTLDRMTGALAGIPVHLYWNPIVAPSRPLVTPAPVGYGVDFYAANLATPTEFLADETGIVTRLDWLAWARDKGATTHVWTQAFKLGKGDEAHTVEAIRRATDAGVDWVGVWGYRCSHAVGCLRCAEPERQWDAILDAVRDARREAP